MWACVAALVAWLPVEVEPPWTVKTLPMLRERPPVDAPAPAPPLDPPPDAVPVPDVLPEVDPPPLDGVSLGVAAGLGCCWLGAGTWHDLWHSALLMKLLLLPWQPPYQNCKHLEVMTSKW